MIIPVYQPLGSSTHLLAQKIGEKIGEKATHTGTLDPMAEGVVIVLTGKDRFDKEKFSSWKKEYKFQILWGLSTDSHDLLGVNTSMEYLVWGMGYGVWGMENMIFKILPEFLGEQQQALPLFSAKRIDGESYFDKAKKGEKIITEKQKIEVFDFRLVSTISMSIGHIRQYIFEKNSLVKGDFRQQEILENWSETFSELEKIGITKLPISTLVATTSKRTYVRGLVRDISQKIGVPATTFSIVRTRNGEYGVEDCKQNNNYLSTKITV